MNVLALDIANNTGWAMYVDGKAVYGSLDFGQYVDRGQMGCVFEQWFCEQIEVYEIRRVAFEQPFGRSSMIEHIRGLAFLTEKVCVDVGVERRIYTASEWRKKLLGKSPRKSAAAKKAVIDWCVEHGFDPANSDEADAIGLLTVALMEVK